MACSGPSDGEIASMTARNNEQVHSLLRRLCSKVPVYYIVDVPRLDLWWNAGRPEPAAKESLDHHTEMLCALCQRIEKSSLSFIDQTNGLRAWWDEHQRLDAERDARKKADRARSKALRTIKKKLEAAGLTPEELEQFGYHTLRTLLA